MGLFGRFKKQELSEDERIGIESKIAGFLARRQANLGIERLAALINDVGMYRQLIASDEDWRGREGDWGVFGQN